MLLMTLSCAKDMSSNFNFDGGKNCYGYTQEDDPASYFCMDSTLVVVYVLSISIASSVVIGRPAKCQHDFGLSDKR